MVSLLSFRTFSCNNIKSKHCKQLNSIDWAQYSRINSIFGSLLRYYRLVMLFCYLFMSHTQTEYNMRYHSYISDVALFFSNFVLLIERVYVWMFFFACRKIHSWKMSKTNKKKIKHRWNEKSCTIWCICTIHHFTSDLRRNIIFDQTNASFRFNKLNAVFHVICTRCQCEAVFCIRILFTDVQSNVNICIGCETTTTMKNWAIALMFIVYCILTIVFFLFSPFFCSFLGRTLLPWRSTSNWDYRYEFESFLISSCHKTRSMTMRTFFPLLQIFY